MGCECLNRTTSVPIPKFAPICRWLDANFGIKRDTSNRTILVWLLDLKFLSERAE